MVSLFSIFNLRLSLSLLSKSSSPLPHESSSDVVFCFIFFSNANAKIPHSFSDIVQHNILLGSEKKKIDVIML